MKHNILSAINLLNRPWAATPEAVETVTNVLKNKLATNNLMIEEDELFTLPEVTRIYGNVAVVSIVGIILPKAGLVEKLLFGAFSLQDLRKELKALKDNDSIDTVILYIDSPGGLSQGVREAGEQIDELTQYKKVIAYTDGMAASAAYWLASQAEEIFCSSSSELGSIGVYTTHIDITQAMQNEGVKLELFKAGTNKAMGLTGTSLTDEQRAIIQAGIDEVYQEFTQTVLTKRDLEESTMQGLTYSGEDAVELGLADYIEADIDGLLDLFIAPAELMVA